MNNLAIDPNPQAKLNNFNTRADLKLLVFEVETLTLAVPILQVQKVVRYNPLQGSGLSHVKLAHLGDREVAIIDLHQKLFKVSLPQSSQAKGYFIISKNITPEPLGIFVSESPALIDVSTSQVRLIPDSYRRADTLGIASHVAVIPQDDRTSQTIFILDWKQLTIDN